MYCTVQSEVMALSCLSSEKNIKLFLSMVLKVVKIYVDVLTVQYCLTAFQDLTFNFVINNVF